MGEPVLTSSYDTVGVGAVTGGVTPLLSALFSKLRNKIYTSRYIPGASGLRSWSTEVAFE